MDLKDKYRNFLKSKIKGSNNEVKEIEKQADEIINDLNEKKAAARKDCKLSVYDQPDEFEDDESSD